jgi:hypothetical protein
LKVIFCSFLNFFYEMEQSTDGAQGQAAQPQQNAYEKVDNPANPGAKQQKIEQGARE